MGLTFKDGWVRRGTVTTSIKEKEHSGARLLIRRDYSSRFIANFVIC